MKIYPKLEAKCFNCNQTQTLIKHYYTSADIKKYRKMLKEKGWIFNSKNEFCCKACEEEYNANIKTN